MSEKELKQIADDAAMIVKGYAFSYKDNFISVLNLNNPSRAMLISKDGEIIESNTDEIEEALILKIWNEDPNITPHVCRHTYCSNMARARMNPKTLQYLMGHSDILVTMNTYTHLGFEYAKDEMVRVEELESAKVEIQKVTSDKIISKKMFKVV